MSEVTTQLNELMAWVSWGSLALCMAGIFLTWLRWKRDAEVEDGIKVVLVIMVCVAVISNAVRIAQWLV